MSRSSPTSSSRCSARSPTRRTLRTRCRGCWRGSTRRKGAWRNRKRPHRNPLPRRPRCLPASPIQRPLCPPPVSGYRSLPLPRKSLPRRSPGRRTSPRRIAARRATTRPRQRSRPLSPHQSQSQSRNGRRWCARQGAPRSVRSRRGADPPSQWSKRRPRRSSPEAWRLPGRPGGLPRDLQLLFEASWRTVMTGTTMTTTSSSWCRVTGEAQRASPRKATKASLCATFWTRRTSSTKARCKRRSSGRRRRRASSWAAGARRARTR
mmetsp:Transcript_16859/g.32302  ORF Transcript_16859/g.32302 Transcript_16859/m.32302 type:complete len:264 (-) Transcript_16859:604-1395(-)